jgi:hypothetical protein
MSHSSALLTRLRHMIYCFNQSTVMHHNHPQSVEFILAFSMKSTLHEYWQRASREGVNSSLFLNILYI